MRVGHADTNYTEPEHAEDTLRPSRVEVGSQSQFFICVKSPVLITEEKYNPSCNYTFLLLFYEIEIEYGKLSEVTRHALMKVHLEEAKNRETKTKVGGSSRRGI